MRSSYKVKLAVFLIPSYTSSLRFSLQRSHTPYTLHLTHLTYPPQTTSVIMSYNKYARFTFKTPEGRCFLANKATIRKEYERWLAAELRRKIQVQNAAKTSGVIKHEKVDFQVTTTRGETVERGRPTTRKTTISSSVATKRFYETRDLKAKRKATSAADDERPVKKRKTQHVAGIGDVRQVLQRQGGGHHASRSRPRSHFVSELAL